jgi:hypothetical protein
MDCPVCVRIICRPDLAVRAIPYIAAAIGPEVSWAAIPHDLSLRYSLESLRACTRKLSHGTSVRDWRYNIYRGFRGTNNAIPYVVERVSV